MARLITRRFLICVGAALLAPFLGAATSQAQAVTGKFFTQTPVTGTAVLPECSPPDLVGTLTLTNTTKGTFAATATGFHIEGFETEAYRVDFPDGRYVIGVAVGHFKVC
jgi:hypothetical protein